MTNGYQRGAPVILLCDDSAIERSSIARWLQSSGYMVHEAEDGEAALEMLRELQVDLVLLDLNMPQVDGFGVLTYLQEHRRSLPVIVLSGMQPNKIQNGIHKLPTHELPPLLMKPIDADQLLGVVALALEGGFPAHAGR